MHDDEVSWGTIAGSVSTISGVGVKLRFEIVGWSFTRIIIYSIGNASTKLLMNVGEPPLEMVSPSSLL